MSEAVNSRGWAEGPEPSVDVESFLALAEASGQDSMRDALARAYGVISQMLESVRSGRDIIQRTAVQKLQFTEAKLNEISDATETAAFDMLDGLDRALLLVDRFEQEALEGKSSRVAPELREEIYNVMGHLQFQDITSQQLNHASSILHEMESHLSNFVRLFGTEAALESPESVEANSGPVTFDTGATVSNAADRQELVDQLISSSRG
jgi:chemotaxis regulatin CheY-phosphate phosphatase CheZ